MTRRRIHLALSIGRPAGSLWRRPGSRIEEAFSLPLLAEVAQAAERAKFDTLFRADNTRLDPSRLRTSGPPHFLEPIVVLSALAGLTSRIGLISTISTTFSAPYNLARQVATLDHLSGGRAGWNVVTSMVGEENFGDQPLPPKSERYARAEEFLRVAEALWTSWDADALVLDRESGVFADDAKVRPIDHAGTYYTVAGPLNIHRPPQTRPVVVQAGRSEEGIGFAARHADVVFAAATDPTGAQEYYRELKARAALAGRDPEKIKVLLGINLTLGRTDHDARALDAEAVGAVDLDKAIEYLQTVQNPLIALRELPLDEPIPVALLDAAAASGNEVYDRGVAWLRHNARLTVRELAVKHRRASMHLAFTGTVDAAADHLAELFESRAADGFVLSPTHLPEGLELVTQGIADELRARGLFREEYEGETLRENLGVQLY
ncbi:NtaA/DmoA family FMN-dependent monooxygenase [Microbacterium sp. BWT-B31]|uniref:NtaA/DmoA family FMN-dependent monooxygenase n=1 Tax=Microbacterium sp. BWT-B31 TaxID=3232072 RepID=UPI003526FFE8